EPVECLAGQLDRLRRFPAGAQDTLAEGVLDLAERVAAATRVRQRDEDGVAIGDDQERRVEAAVVAGMTPHLDVADPHSVAPEAVDAFRRLPVDDPHPPRLRVAEVVLPEPEEIPDRRHEPAGRASGARVRAAVGAGTGAWNVGLAEGGRLEAERPE